MQVLCSYASVAQSVEQGTENPRVIGSIPIGGTIFAGLAHLVERHLAKVEVASSSLVTRSKRGSIAQLGEHLPYKQGVTGSSPVVSTKLRFYTGAFLFYYGPLAQLVRASGS